YSKALEVGCGNGNTLSYLKKSGQAKYVVGVEYQKECSTLHPENIDSFITGSAEDFHTENDQFDLVMFLDVLEHLQDPFQVLKKYISFLSKGGQILVSVPNINNLRVLGKLILKDEFTYTDSGILDRTHIRFFTKTSFLQQ